MSFKDNAINFSSPKIKSEEQLTLLIDKLKKKDKTVGLCVGSYDLLHPGHMKHFESANALCDVLVVGITSDTFVHKRKGTMRPIICETLRAYSISQLSSVDYVLISPYEKATNLIYSLKPSFYIKGSDYKNKHTHGIAAERKAIDEIGSEMKYTCDEKLSTTDLMSSIQKKTEKPILVLGGGMAGVGKSTLLKAFAKKNGFIYIDKDIINESILTKIKNGVIIDHNTYRCSSRYLSDVRYQTYLAMIKLARDNLDIGMNVVLDGYFSDKLSIPFIEEGLADISKRNVIVKVYFTCSRKIVSDRLKQRNLDRDKSKLKDFQKYYEKHKDDDVNLFDIVFNTEGDNSVNVDSLYHEIMNKVSGE